MGNKWICHTGNRALITKLKNKTTSLFFHKKKSTIVLFRFKIYNTMMKPIRYMTAAQCIGNEHFGTEEFVFFDIYLLIYSHKSILIGFQMITHEIIMQKKRRRKKNMKKNS